MPIQDPSENGVGGAQGPHACPLSAHLEQSPVMAHSSDPQILASACLEQLGDCTVDQLAWKTRPSQVTIAYYSQRIIDPKGFVQEDRNTDMS